MGSKQGICPKIWILADDRIGNLNQAIALAEKMGVDYEFKPIKYNIWGKLPNYFLSFYPIHIKQELLNSWKESKLPDLIISSGRRTASLAIYLKRKSGNKIKIIQIMHPNLPFKEFELVILPEHDKIRKNKLNILRVTGALNNVQDKISTAAIELRKNYPTLREFIAVIIGGNSKNYYFTDEDAIKLAKILNNIAKSSLYTLFITFSRRTTDRVKHIIKNNIPISAIIYDPVEEKTKPNPYLGMLARATYIISTVDSISMGSEAASTGKPLYILCPSNFKSLKHLSFLQQLIKLGIAKILDKSVTQLIPYEYTPLNEVERIASIVKTKILEK